jgi:hypothetical protein
MVQPLFPIGYLSNNGETVAEMQLNFEAMNVQFENCFADCVLSGFTGFSSTGLSVTFGMTSGTFFVAIQGGLQYFIPNGDSRITQTVSASQDTYVDFSGGSFTLNAVANNATPPALAAGALRIALIVSGSSTISGVYYFSVPTALAFALGGGGNSNNSPTSGTLTGEYWQTGTFTSSGVITANQLRLHVVGDVIINNAITVSEEMSGGSGFQFNSSPVCLNGVVASGISPGQNAAGGGGGGGGGNGGAGGKGGWTTTLYTVGGAAVPFLNLTGSGGGGGGAYTANPGMLVPGGTGGGGIYIEASGNIIVLANITANGGAGGSTSVDGYGGGGGGSGGCIELRAGGQIYIANGVTLSAQGGAGGNSTNTTLKGGAGGGGGGGFIRLKGAIINNQGTVSTAGGAAGTGATAQLAQAGATGVIDSTAVIWGPRSPN